MKKLAKIPIALIVLLVCVLTILIIFLMKGDTDRLTKQLNLGQKYVEEQNYEQAIAAYELAIEIDPRDERAYIALSDIYVIQDKLDDAISILKEGLKQCTSTNLQAKLDELEEKKKELSSKAVHEESVTAKSGKIKSKKKDSQNSPQNTKKSKLVDEGDIFDGQYDRKILEYFADTDWFIVQAIENKFLTVEYPAKGDLPLLVLNQNGDVIYEGLTDSMYGETYISEYEGEPVVVSWIKEDIDSEYYMRTITDSEGNELSREKITEDAWQKEVYKDFPMLESTQTSNLLTIENNNAEVLIFDSEGNQIANFMSDENQTEEEQSGPLIYGEIKGRFLIIEKNNGMQDDYGYITPQYFIYRILGE